MIKFLDLKLINKRFENEFKNEFGYFLNSGQYILGNQVLKFEEEFASYCGTKYCIGVSSGLEALQLIFEAYEILGKLCKGDEVIVPANTYIASVLAISHAGLKPVLVEPDVNTYNIDVSKIEQVVTTKTKAVLGVHLYGQLYDVEQLEKICKSNNLLLIEDAAQAHGSINFDGRKAGNLSHAAAFSFYPTKNLGALGDAGAVTTNNIELAVCIKKLRNYGSSKKNINEYMGFNNRLDELQATFLNIKLKSLDADNEKRREIAVRYLSKINNEKIVFPYYNNSENHVFYAFVIRVTSREKFIKHLEKNGIGWLIHYPIPPHKQKAFSQFNHLKLPITETIHNTIISLPISPVMTSVEVSNIIDVVNAFF